MADIKWWRARCIRGPSTIYAQVGRGFQDESNDIME